MSEHSVVWWEGKCTAFVLLFGSLKASYTESSSSQRCPFPAPITAELKQKKSWLEGMGDGVFFEQIIHWCLVLLFGRLLERGVSFVGTDYLSPLLWDKYIEYEYSQQEWSRLAQIYTRILQIPLQNLDRYYSRSVYIVRLPSIFVNFWL